MQMNCIFTNTAFVVTHSVYTHLWGHLHLVNVFEGPLCLY